MEVVKIDTEIAETFKINIAEVQGMVKEYQKLTLIPEDEDSYKVCRVALTSCIRTRTGINKRRLKLNKKDQEQIKGRNTAAKQLAAIIEPAETYLTSLVKGEYNRIEAIKEAEAAKEREKIEKRITDLAEYRVMLPFMEVAAMTDEEFEAVLAKERAAYETEQKRLAEEEATRKAEAKELKELRERQHAEAERLHQIEIKQIEERQKLEAEAKAIQDEKDRLELEKVAERQRKDREEFERKAKEGAKIQAEADMKAKAEREAKEAKEREIKAAEKVKRVEALKPDREKLFSFADYLLHTVAPTFRHREAQQLADEIVIEIHTMATALIEKAKKL